MGGSYESTRKCLNDPNSKIARESDSTFVTVKTSIAA
jgi:hypothetical protein